MGTEKLVLLEADIAAQRSIINRIFATLELRIQSLVPENLEKLESIAYQLHNLYGAIEDLLKLVASYFENHISDVSQWHSQLLKRMMQPVKGVRPALISFESYDLLNALRGFRHFFRHAYGVPLDFGQLQSNLNKALHLKPIFDRDLDIFVELLRSLD
jgi:hypothetical protein